MTILWFNNLTLEEVMSYGGHQTNRTEFSGTNKSETPPKHNSSPPDGTAQTHEYEVSEISRFPVYGCLESLWSGSILIGRTHRIF